LSPTLSRRHTDVIPVACGPPEPHSGHAAPWHRGGFPPSAPRGLSLPAAPRVPFRGVVARRPPRDAWAPHAPRAPFRGACPWPGPWCLLRPHFPRSKSGGHIFACRLRTHRFGGPHFGKLRAPFRRSIGPTFRKISGPISAALRAAGARCANSRARAGSHETRFQARPARPPGRPRGLEIGPHRGSAFFVFRAPRGCPRAQMFSPPKAAESFQGFPNPHLTHRVPENFVPPAQRAVGCTADRRGGTKFSRGMALGPDRSRSPWPLPSCTA